MNTWFTVKVKYTKQLENGAFKRVSEPYLLAAMTFTDAEARIYEELGAIIRGEFSVTNIARTDYHDIFHYEDSDQWFKCKVAYESQDADTDKKITILMQKMFSTRSEALAAEREVLNTFSHLRVIENDFLKSKGNTELFKEDILQLDTAASLN